LLFFFFFNDTATTEIYPLSLHDALPIFHLARADRRIPAERDSLEAARPVGDRKSTRLNSSHSSISYAVFCLKKTRAISVTVTSTSGALSKKIRRHEPGAI